ncbi:hypothetical protein H1C71_024113 [Ictidomys tridecemlineatus]|nr:hypothetical protein H1C71_024113 [Ictidomys tridecemlineatus]
MDFGVKMQGSEPVSTMKVSESEGKLEGLATAVTPNKNSSNSSCAGGISSSSSSSSRGGSAKGWQYSSQVKFKHSPRDGSNLPRANLFTARTLPHREANTKTRLLPY